MDELLACFFWSGEAGEVEGLSWGLRRFQIAVGNQWKEGAEGVGEGVRTSSGKRGFQVLNLIQYAFVVCSFLDND